MPCLPLLAAVLAAGAPLPASDTAPVRNVSYQITFDRALAARRTLHVEMRFDVTGDGDVLLSLPAWTPGAYEITGFARWVSAFEADRDGAPLDWDKSDPDTWRIAAPGAGPLAVRFEVLADSLDTAMAWAREEFAFFNGTTVFPYPEGADLSAYPATMRIVTDPEWLVATGMTPGDSAGVWRERTYHDLVDMPVFVGRFDLDSMPVRGAWVRLATYPSGSVAGETRAQVWTALQRMIPPMAAVFDDVPFRTYTLLQIADSSFGGASGLEHQNSHVDIVAPLAVGNPLLNGLYAHEIFHAWNVKRLRPAEMVPYRYDAWQPTTLLWMSEGVTDYYADLALLRGGLITPDQFYALTTEKIEQVANTPPVALEDASLSTWFAPADGSGYVYYPKGSLAGLLLDVLIRHSSRNRGSLDVALRELYRSTYQRNRGFTEDDFWAAVSRAADGAEFAEFRSRWIDGRDPFPWDSVLPFAGLRLQADTLRQARIGVSTTMEETGARVVAVVPGGMAEAVGVRPGDLLVRIGEIDAADPSFGADFRRLYARSEGEPVELVVRREDEEVELRGRIMLAPIVTRRVVAEPAPSAAALRVREGLLTGTVSR